MSLDEILKKYAQHLPNCDINQPMWHKSPCDCGLAELVKALSPYDRAKLGGRAAICTTCEDTGQASSGNWCGCELGVNRRKCEEASNRYGGLLFVLGKCCGCGAEGIPTTPLGPDGSIAPVCEACYDREMRDSERAERVATGGHVGPCGDFDGDGYCDGCNREMPDGP